MKTKNHLYKIFLISIFALTMFSSKSTSAQKKTDTIDFSGNTNTKEALLLNDLLLYAYELKDEAKTAEICHDIIINYPDSEIIRFNRSFRIDIYAAETLVKTFSLAKNYKGLALECQQILRESTNPPIEIIASTGIILSYIRENKYDIALENLMHIIHKYPNEKRYQLTTQVNYSIIPLSCAINAFINFYGDYSKALELSLWISKNMKEPKFIEFADMKTAQLLDESCGDKEQVLTAYKKVKNLHLYDPYKKEELIPFDGRSRFDDIKNFRSQKVIIKENAVFKPAIK